MLHPLSIQLLSLQYFHQIFFIYDITYLLRSTHCGNSLSPSLMLSSNPSKGLSLSPYEDHSDIPSELHSRKPSIFKRMVSSIIPQWNNQVQQMIQTKILFKFGRIINSNHRSSIYPSITPSINPTINPTGFPSELSTPMPSHFHFFYAINFYLRGTHCIS